MWFITITYYQKVPAVLVESHVRVDVSTVDEVILAAEAPTQDKAIRLCVAKLEALIQALEECKQDIQRKYVVEEKYL